MELNDGDTLYLVKDVDFDETRTELRYTIPLKMLSVMDYRYEQRPCNTLITLKAVNNENAFGYRMAKYLGNRMTEHEGGSRNELTLTVYKDPERRIIQALLDLAGRVSEGRED